MKKYFFLTLFLFPFALIAQEGVAPNINNLTPKWYHVLKDSNFVQDTFGLNIRTPYNICFPRKLKIANHQLLINNTCTSGLGDYHGNIIQNIDTKTGQMKWVQALNNDNYLTQQEYFQGMFYDSILNQVVLTGFRKLGQPATTSPGWFASQASVLSTLTLNSEKGHIEDHIINSDLADSIRWKPNTGIFMRSSEHNNWYLRGLPIDKGCLHTFDRITADQKLISNPNLEYFSEKINDNPVYFLGENLIDQDNHDNMYGIIMNKHFFYSNPFNAKIIKFHLNDEPNITNSSLNVEFEKDVTQYIQLPETEFGFLLNALVTDESIYLTGAYLDTLNNFGLKLWLVGLDANGQDLFYIKSLKLEEIDANGIRFIGRKNGRIYYCLTANNKNRTIYSIDDQGNTLSHGVIVGADLSNKVEFNNAVFSDENDIIISMRVDEKYWYTAAYDAKDFGIDFSSSTEAIANHQDAFRIYPNPTHQTITIQSEKETNGTFYLNDAMGRLVRKMPLQVTHTTLDLSDLPSGIYNLKLPSDDHANVLNHKIVKW